MPTKNFKNLPPWLTAFTTDKAVFTETVIFYCPTKKRTGADLWLTEVSKLVDGVMKYLLTNLKGATMSEGTGFFEDDKGEVHMEKVIMCKALCSPEKLKKEYRNIYYMANSLAILFEQDSMAVEINGRMYFFSPNDAYSKKFQEKYLKDWRSGKLQPLGFHAYIDKEVVMVGSKK
jgi:hypothetical protein